MRTTHHLAGIVCAMLASGLALPATAEEKESGFFFNVGTGVNWAEDVDIEVAGVSSTADLDVGIRVAVGGGYNINKYLGVGFETGYIWNGFDGNDNSLSHLPGMFNGELRIPNVSKLEPYLGGGIGGSWNILYVDGSGGNDWDVDSDFNFAWQATGGVRYKFVRNMSLGIGYKYFGTSSSDYHINGTNPHIGTSNNHTLNVAFNMMF